MLKRIGTAVILLVVVLGALLGLRQIHTAFADVIGVIIICMGAYEMFNAFKKAEYNPIALPIIFLCIAIYPAALFLQEIGILIAFILTSMLAIIIFTFVHKHTLKDLIATIFIMFYPIILFSPFFIINNSDIGLLAIMLMLFVPIMTDTMAYFVGITFKGKKMCPSISPKKTISGGIGGVIGGVMGALLVFVLFDVCNVFSSFANVVKTQLTDSIALSAIIYTIIGLVGGIICELGDLGASWIKRQAQIKDFGKIFPGHGGIMDRLDSILFMLPIVYILTTVIKMIV